MPRSAVCSTWNTRPFNNSDLVTTNRRMPVNLRARPVSWQWTGGTETYAWCWNPGIRDVDLSIRLCRIHYLAGTGQETRPDLKTRGGSIGDHREVFDERGNAGVPEVRGGPGTLQECRVRRQYGIPKRARHSHSQNGYRHCADHR